MSTRPVPPGLAPFWSGPLNAFATLSSPPITPEMQERHRMYSLLLMWVVNSKWNGNKCGETGDYGIWRPSQQLAELPGHQKIYRGGSYLGHNIAALAVDGEGRVMDFDFNHNDVFDSSVEHAESRLVRRLFALNQIYDSPADQSPSVSKGGAEPPRRALRSRQQHHLFATAISDRPAVGVPGAIPAVVPYGNLLKDVTIYTSLESCAQCSGIMCLASVKEIVYLQWDQGQFLIGNMMWQATNAQKAGFIAPRPIRGDEFGFEYFDSLNSANDEFSRKVVDYPFYVDSQGKPVKTPSVTSFLCTDTALKIYGAAAAELDKWPQARFPGFKPAPSALSNAQVLAEVKQYAIWVSQLGNRGTPHRV